MARPSAGAIFCRKSRQHSAVPSSISLQAAEDRELILLVGDAKAGLERDVRAKLA